MTSGPVTVAVCIATLRRPKGLESLLEGLSNLEFGSVEAPRLRIIVVDNDAEQSEGVAVAEAWRARFSELVAVVEARRGISYARNRALDLAGDADFVAFIDDDEVPSPHWLDELLRVQREYGADVVGGPVLPVFDETPPPWLLRGPFFTRPRRSTGTPLHVAYSGNVLFDWSRWGEYRFSERYAHSGGEDSHFFGRLHLLGARIVWADEAVVYERNPASRQTVRWLVQRNYRIGLVRATIDQELGIGRHPRRTSAWQACTRFARGTSTLLTSGGKPEKVTLGLTQLAAGVGRVAGILGLWFEEYR